MKDLILEAVDNEYLIEIEHETLGYLNQTPRQMLDHLLALGRALDFADTKRLLTKRDGEWNVSDFADTKELLTKRDGEWNVSENPQLYFNRVEKTMKGLLRNGITSDPNERRDITLFYLKATGEFDAAVREWLQNQQPTKRGQTSRPSSLPIIKENKQNPTEK